MKLNIDIKVILIQKTWRLSEDTLAITQSKLASAEVAGHRRRDGSGLWTAACSAAGLAVTMESKIKEGHKLRQTGMGEGGGAQAAETADGRVFAAWLIGPAVLDALARGEELQRHQAFDGGGSHDRDVIPIIT